MYEGVLCVHLCPETRCKRPYLQLHPGVVVHCSPVEFAASGEHLACIERSCNLSRGNGRSSTGYILGTTGDGCQAHRQSLPRVVKPETAKGGRNMPVVYRLVVSKPSRKFPATRLCNTLQSDTGWSYEGQRWQGTQQVARTDEDIYANSSCLEIDSTLTLSAQGFPAVKEEVSGGKMQGWLLANRPMNLDAIVAPICTQPTEHLGSHHAT